MPQDGGGFGGPGSFCALATEVRSGSSTSAASVSTIRFEERNMEDLWAPGPSSSGKRFAPTGRGMRRRAALVPRESRDHRRAAATLGWSLGEARIERCTRTVAHTALL